MEGGYGENGPKLRQMRNLGHRYCVFFKISSYIMILNNIFIAYLGYDLRNTYGERDGKRRRRKPAQTTPDAWFGP